MTRRRRRRRRRQLERARALHLRLRSQRAPFNAFRASQVCLRTFVPPSEADVVFLDFYFGQGTVEQAIQRLLSLTRQLRSRAYGPRPPFVVVLLNRFWCLTNSGEDPNNLATKVDGKLTLLMPDKTSLCRHGSEVDRFRLASARVTAENRQVEEGLRRHFDDCGGFAVLSVFEELAPLILSGELRSADVSSDGIHPNFPSATEHCNRQCRAALGSVGHVAAAFEAQHLTAAWARVLTRWGVQVLRGEPTGAQGSTVRTRQRCKRAVGAVDASVSSCFGAEPWLPQPEVFRMTNGFEWVEPYDRNLFKRSLQKPGWLSSRAGATLLLRIDHGLWQPLAERASMISVQLFFLHTCMPAFHCMRTRRQRQGGGEPPRQSILLRQAIHPSPYRHLRRASHATDTTPATAADQLPNALTYRAQVPAYARVQTRPRMQGWRSFRVMGHALVRPSRSPRYGSRDSALTRLWQYHPSLSWMHRSGVFSTSRPPQMRM